MWSKVNFGESDCGRFGRYLTFNCTRHIFSIMQSSDEENGRIDRKLLKDLSTILYKVCRSISLVSQNDLYAMWGGISLHSLFCGISVKLLSFVFLFLFFDLNLLNKRCTRPGTSALTCVTPCPDTSSQSCSF